MKTIQSPINIVFLSLIVLAAGCLPPAAIAAAITWSTPANITADANVSTTGTAVYAYDWANASETVNGVSFTGASSTSGASPNVSISTSTGAIDNTTSAYTSSSAPFANLSTAYKGILVGGDYAGSSSATFTVTLNNLVVGNNYAVQVWVNDPRGNENSRTETASSSGGNTVTIDYSTGSGTTGGTPGQYTIGTFTASSTTQAFTLLGAASTQVNALQLRKVGQPTNYWGGYVNGSWDYVTTNWGYGESFAYITNGFTSVNFSDTNDFNNAVVNSNISVQAGGVSIGSINFLNNQVNYTFTNAGGSLGITGATVINKTGTGIVTLAGMETYTGATSISAGKLALGAGGSIASSSAINLASNAVFDVSAAGGYALGSSQPLSGTGGVNGNVNALGAQIIPGGVGAIGTLTFSNNLTLGGQTLTFDMNASSNDRITVMGTVTNNGAVAIVINPLATLSAGTYTLISYAALTGSGSFVLTNSQRNLTLNTGATALTVTVAGSVGSLTWVGDGVANNWDVQITTNWLDGGTSASFFQYDNVTFNNTGSDSPAINLEAALLPGSVTVNAMQNYTFAGSGEIGGVAGLTQAGSGTLILDNSGSNTFTGGITISAGTLQAGNNDANGNLPAGNVTNNATLAFDWSSSPTVAGVISGSGVVYQSGSGTTVLSGANTYTGGTTISNGTLQLNAATSGGTGTILVNTNTTLALSEGSGNTFANVISGSGTISVVGTGNTNYVQVGSSLAGFTGSLDIGFAGAARFVNRTANSGLAAGVTVNITNNGQLYLQSGTAAANLNVSGTGDGDGLGAMRVDAGATAISGGSVTLNGNTAISANSGTIADVIGDGGFGYGFTKLNTGTLTLSAANTYGGTTTISNGTVLLSATGSISNSAVINLQGGTFDVSQVSGGFSLNTSPRQTLSGSGMVNGSFNAPAGSQVIPGGIGVAGTLVFSNGLTLNGQTMPFDLGATPTGSGNDLVTVLASPLTLNSNSAISLNFLAGSLSPGIYTLFTYPSLAGTGTFTLASAYPGVTLNIGATATTISVGAAGVTLTWVGDGRANNWDLVTANWLNGASPADFVQSNNVTFNDAGSDTPAINLTTALLPASVTVNASENYTFSGPGSLSGAAYLVSLGSGTLTINTSNNYTGGTTISGGTLQLGTNGTTGSIIGPIADNSQLVFDRSNTNTDSNVISGTGSLTVNGSGLEILTATNTFSGGTTINAGTLQLNTLNAAGSGPVVDNSVLNLLAGGFKFTNSFSGSGLINIVPNESSYASTNIGSDYAQFNGSLNINATINVPVGPGVARVVTTSANGSASTLSINVTNGGQLYVQSGTLAATVSVSGSGYGDGLGALRVSSGATLSGTVTLTGNAAIGNNNIGNGVITGTIADNDAGYGVTVVGGLGGVIEFSGIYGEYYGNTTINTNATLMLVNGAAIEDSPAINIGPNATFNVSGDGVSSYPIPTGIGGAAATQALAGVGENGIINGNISLGSGGSLGAAISNDGQPSLIVTNGTLTLADNPVVVTASALPLTGGVYPLVGIATNGNAGAVAGDVSTSTLTFAGCGLAAEATGSLVLSNTALYLVVIQPPATPATFSSASALPGNAGFQLVFSGSDGHNYSVLATTNLAMPLPEWQVIASGQFGSGLVTNIDLTSTNYPQRFYTILSQ